MIDWDIEMLLCLAVGKTEEQAEKIINDGGIDQLCFDEYEIDFEHYCLVVKGLLPFTPQIETAVTKTRCNAFIDAKQGLIIVKQEVAK